VIAETLNNLNRIITVFNGIASTADPVNSVTITQQLQKQLDLINSMLIEGGPYYPIGEIERLVTDESLKQTVMELVRICLWCYQHLLQQESVSQKFQLLHLTTFQLLLTQSEYIEKHIKILFPQSACDYVRTQLMGNEKLNAVPTFLPQPQYNSAMGMHTEERKRGLHMQWPALARPEFASPNWGTLFKPVNTVQNQAIVPGQYVPYQPR